MKKNTTDVDEFERKWKSLADDLARLKWNLPSEKHDDVDRVKGEVYDLIEDAAEHYEDQQ